MIEIIFSCWLIFMSDGSAYCYCDNEQSPPQIAVESVGIQRETDPATEAWLR